MLLLLLLLLQITQKKPRTFSFRVQVGQMGCVPACGRNSNSRNVSCSQPSLHHQGAPSGRGAI